MLNQLVRINPYNHAEILPDLAESWEAKEGGTLWVFHLRPGIRWHDGTLLTSEDVKFSYERVLKVPEGLQLGRAAPLRLYIQSVEAPDPLTVVIRTKFPAASFLANIASVYASIYPKEATQRLSPPTMERFDSVIGSGPFKFKEFTRGSRYRLERNPDYFVEGRPYLDEVWYLVMPNSAIRFAALRSHEVDIIPIGITEAQAEEVWKELSDRVGLLVVATANFWAVQLNTRVEPFTDPRVRKAVNLAIDRNAAIELQGGGYKGAFMPPSGPWGLPVDEVAELPGLGNKAVERQFARKLLAAAGYPQGLKVTILSRAGAYFQEIAAFVLDQLKSVGIEGEIDARETVAYLDLLRGRNFQITASSSALALDDPDQVFSQHYLCQGTENFPQICDAEVERLFNEQQREVDFERRRELVWEMQRRLWDLNGKVIINWSIRRTPYWREVKGFAMGASNYQGMRLEEVWKEGY
jgi:peptide/nickel transport system substrate-binding protein